MKVNLIAVGKIKEGFYTSAVGEYAKRMSRFVDFKVVELSEYPPKSQSAADIALSLKREGELILTAAKGFTVLTAIDGELLSSEGLARLINEKMTDGISEISFIIGGSNGVSDAVSAHADYKLSFGRLTYPHQLMRVILTEQIYRAFTINAGLPYHK